MEILIKEIKNEILKIYSTKILIAIIVSIILFCGFNIFNQLAVQYSDNWRQEIADEIILNNDMMEEISDETNSEIIESNILQNKKLQFYLDNDISPNTTVLQFVNESMDVNFLLIILSSLVFSKVFCVETSYGTEKIYLTRSINRRYLIASKLIAATIVTCFIYIIAGLIALIFGLIFFLKNGFGTKAVILNSAGLVVLGNYFPQMVNSFLINLLLILFIVVLTSFIATISRNQLLSVMIPFLIWNFGGTIADTTSFISTKYQMLFFVYPLNYFTSINSSTVTWNDKTTVIMTVSILIYTVLILIFTATIFIRRSSCGGKWTYILRKE